MIEKVVKKYKLNDPQQEIDDQEFWDSQTIEYKISVLEMLRNEAYPQLRGENGIIEGFPRIHRIVKQKRS